MDKDPVCGMQVDPAHAATQRKHQGKTYYFCSPSCAAKFDQSPERYIAHEQDEPSGGDRAGGGRRHGT